MPPLETLVAFFAAIALIAFLPGPSMLYAAAQTLARGRRAGLFAALGIHVGGYAHVAAAAAGLSALFHAVPVLYTITRLAGAAYLVWLGASILRNRNSLSHVPPRLPARPPDPAPTRPAGKAFLHSIAVEVLNPKTAVFFVAFLPQFVDAGASLSLGVQFLVLGTVVNLVFSAADLVCVALADAVVIRMRRSDAMQRTLQRLGGGVLIGLGVHLALQKN